MVIYLAKLWADHMIDMWHGTPLTGTRADRQPRLVATDDWPLVLVSPCGPGGETPEAPNF